jgi:hypothetical protein
MRLHGSRLDMHDKLVWEVVVQMIKEENENMADYLRVSLRECARRMGWSDSGGKNLKWIWRSIEKLSQARLELSLPQGATVAGPLLDCAADGNGAYRIRVNPILGAAVFNDEIQFRINFQRRRQLASTLAQWLHDFLSTHSTAGALTIGYLRDLSGFCGQARRFPANLANALDQLQRLAPSLLVGFEIEKRGKDSDRWILRARRGPEQPDFILPRRERDAALGSRAPNGKGARHGFGGVAL